MIAINRLSPNINGVEIEINSSFINPTYHIDIFHNSNLIKEVITNESYIHIDDLPCGELFEIKVTCNNEETKRLFVTGDYRGLVVNYLNVDDPIYQESGEFIGSPFLIKFHNKLFITMDVFKKGGTEQGHIISFLFYSDDDGKNWKYIREFRPTQWGTMFIYDDHLYFVSTELHNKGVTVFASEDGFNWSKQYKILDGPYHTAPTAPLVDKDKIYIAIKRYDEDNNSFACVLIGDGQKDLFNQDSWKLTNEFCPPFSLGGDQKIHYCDEGNVIKYKEDIFVLYRFAYKKALMMKINKDEFQFYKIIDLECGWCKFYIIPHMDYYLAMGNTICFPRNVINLYKSYDLENWEKIQNIDDISFMEDVNHNGIQYPTFFVENNQIYVVIRTALNNADTFHNSNCVTFKKIPFRD